MSFQYVHGSVSLRHSMLPVTSQTDPISIGVLICHPDTRDHIYNVPLFMLLVMMLQLLFIAIGSCDIRIQRDPQG